MTTIQHNIVEQIFTGDQPVVLCNLQEKMEELTSPEFDYSSFVDSFCHDYCDRLAYWLHDTYGLKIGAIRAIDMNDDDDTEYETVVHQFVMLDDDVVLDGRGITTTKSMMQYYEMAGADDEENWDLLLAENYPHAPKATSNRQYADVELDFKSFINLLNIELERQSDQF